MTAKRQRSARRSDEPKAMKPAASNPHRPIGFTATAPIDVTMLSRLIADLGRLVARSEMRRRRGYSLPELLIGALVVTLVLYALAHVMVLPPR